VTAPGHQPVADLAFSGADRVVVAVLELLDHLERPPPVQHVPPDDPVAQQRRLVGAAVRVVGYVPAARPHRA
jgi:hypothetical protein